MNYLELIIGKMWYVFIGQVSEPSSWVLSHQRHAYSYSA